VELGLLDCGAWQTKHLSALLHLTIFLHLLPYHTTIPYNQTIPHQYQTRAIPINQATFSVASTSSVKLFAPLPQISHLDIHSQFGLHLCPISCHIIHKHEKWSCQLTECFSPHLSSSPLLYITPTNRNLDNWISAKSLHTFISSSFCWMGSVFAFPSRHSLEFLGPMCSLSLSSSSCLPVHLELIKANRVVESSLRSTAAAAAAAATSVVASFAVLLEVLYTERNSLAGCTKQGKSHCQNS